MGDEMATNALCKTNVYTYEMDVEMIQKLRDRYEEFDKAIKYQ